MVQRSCIGVASDGSAMTGMEGERGLITELQTGTDDSLTGKWLKKSDHASMPFLRARCEGMKK